MNFVRRLAAAKKGSASPRRPLNSMELQPGSDELSRYVDKVQREIIAAIGISASSVATGAERGESRGSATTKPAPTGGASKPLSESPAPPPAQPTVCARITCSGIASEADIERLAAWPRRGGGL